MRYTKEERLEIGRKIYEGTRTEIGTAYRLSRKVQRKHRTGNRKVHKILQQRASQICAGIYDAEKV